MFSLIITIISIALVAALALATLYYGGDAFNKGTAGAEASRLINEGQQVNGAVALAKADANPATTLAGLVTAGYLSQLPGSFSGAGAVLVDGSQDLTVASSALVCEEVQKRAGVSSGDSPATAPAGQLYGCTVDDVDTPTAWTFYFKL